MRHGNIILNIFLMKRFQKFKTILLGIKEALIIFLKLSVRSVFPTDPLHNVERNDISYPWDYLSSVWVGAE